MTECAPAVERLLGCITIDETTGCWLYPTEHHKTPGGYGSIAVDVAGRLRQQPAHRFAHEHWIGPIPDGYHVDHVWARGCRHKSCCNPDHLEAVTPSENVKRGKVSTRERKAAAPPPPPTTPGTLSIAEAAVELEVNESTIRRRINRDTHELVIRVGTTTHTIPLYWTGPTPGSRNGAWRIPTAYLDDALGRRR